MSIIIITALSTIDLLHSRWKYFTRKSKGERNTTTLHNISPPDTTTLHNISPPDTTTLHNISPPDTTALHNISPPDSLLEEDIGYI
jgi:hypothetical protein